MHGQVRNDGESASLCPCEENTIGANLAEGCCRHSDKDFARFVDISLGSASEVEYFLLLGHDLGYMPNDDYQKFSENVQEV
ncbi:MAG: four helix bundle protein, partial [Chloroflexi bacterium]|nr:four helix bundle protein [Chloroflexota bacterium]